MTRLLLVEVAATDRFHRAVTFPYLLGFARLHAVQARWLRFAVPAAIRFAQQGEGVGFEATDARRLRQVVAEFEPTHVVFNRRPADELVRQLAASSPDLRLAVLGDTYATPADVRGAVAILADRPQAWAAFLGLALDVPAAAEGLPVPDFGYEPANAAAQNLQPLPFLVLGTECTYAAPLDAHPDYAGVDLSGCIRQDGCTFCARPPFDRPVPRFDPASARRQLQTLSETLPPYAGRLAVRLLGEPALRHIEELCAFILELGLPPADWLLDARADRLVRRRPALAAAAAGFAGTGHCLQLALIGIENFSRAELLRMNKGVDPLENLDAVATLLELEAAHPETFQFRQHGGLSMILFTPWSTLEDVALNLHVVRAAGLEALCGKLLSARLRLEPGLPITALARHADLLVPRYDDAALDTAARNLYGEELPWRFADERVEAVCRPLIRLSTDTPFEDDPLFDAVRELRAAAHGRGWSAVDVGAALVDEAALAAAGGARPSPEALVASTLAGLQALPPALAPTAEEAFREPTAERRFEHAFLWALSEAGIKPVSKLEPLHRAEAEALQAQFGAAHVAVRARRGSGRGAPGGEPVFEAFLGARAADVQRAAALAGEIQEQHDAKAWGEATQAIGALLGYPACCSDRFVTQESAAARESYAWLHLARRLEAPGAVSPLLHPWAGPFASHYVPCGLDCAESLRRAAAAEDVARRLLAADAGAALDQRLRHPWLVVLRGQGLALELIPDDPPGERFRFRAGLAVGAAREFALAAAADTLQLEAERLLLLRAGRPLLDLSARAFVWWHERAFQQPFWSRILAIRAHRKATPTRASESATPAPPPAQPRHDAMRRVLERALGVLDAAGVRFGEPSTWRVDTDERGGLRLWLGSGPDAVEFQVAEAQAGAPCLFRAGPFAFSHPTDRPLDSAGRRALAARFEQALRGWLSAERRARRH